MTVKVAVTRPPTDAAEKPPAGLTVTDIERSSLYNDIVMMDVISDHIHSDA